MSLLTKFFYNNSTPSKVFIVPTSSGMLAFALNFLLLVFGLLFANNYLLLFNFVIFAFFVLSMFYTHFNLQGLCISQISISPGFAESTTKVDLFLENNKESIKRYDLSVNFYLNQQLYKVDNFNLNTHQKIVQSSLVLPVRGKYQIKRVEVSTLFPLNLFRSFVYFDLNTSIISFPKPIQSKSHQNLFDINFYVSDDEIKLREYLSGNNVKNIFWKKSTGDKIIYKEYSTINQNKNIIDFSDYIDPFNLERSLSELSGIVSHHHQSKVELRCFFEKKLIGIINGEGDDYLKVLTFLAAYES